MQPIVSKPAALTLHCFADGLVEYVALASANTVPGFFAGSTQFGVPYVEFTASAAAAGQVASFRGGNILNKAFVRHMQLLSK